MLKRLIFVFLALASLAFLIDAQQQRSKRTRRSSHPHQRRATRKPAKPPVTSFVTDSGGRELIIRLLDIGQGDATYIRNGSSKVIMWSTSLGSCSGNGAVPIKCRSKSCVG